MKKKLLLVCMALLSLFSAMATVVPTTSTAGNDVWYYIKCSARNTPTAVWLTGAVNGGNLTVSDLITADDSQLWKVIVNTNGFSLVNKQFGTYMNTDVANTVHLTAIDVVPTTALQFVPSITKVGGVLVNDANTVIDVATNVPATTPTFTFYAAGSGYSFHPANLNGNYNPPLEHSSVYFMTSKEMLASTIAEATTVLNNSSEGLNPGQVSPDDREALSLSIDEAQVICDNAASTDNQFLSAMVDLNSISALFKTKVILPEISTGADSWYYIQGTRPANTYMTGAAAGTGTQVKDLAVIPDDTQLWRLVPNGDGFAMQNKASLEYMQTDFPTGTNLSTQATMPTKALRFITSGETYNKAFRFWIENTTSATEALRLHAGGSGNGWGVMNWTGGANDNCTWLFLSYDELFRTQLAAALATAHDLYTASASNVGDEFGQYSTASRTTFAAVIATADALQIASMTQNELKAATQTLNDAIAAFKVNNDVATLSTVTTIKWFRFVNAMSPAGYATGKAMTSNGRIQDQAFTYETVDVASDAQLFRFEMNGDYTKATTLVNKANNLYLSATGTMVATPTDANEFEITPLDGFSFWIKPTTKAPIHAAASNTDIVNWNAGAGSASAWKIVYVKSEPNTADLKPAYTAALTQARNYYNITTGGSEYSQYPVAARTSFNTVIAAEEAKDIATLTNQQFADGINALKDASKAYKATLNLTLGANKWYTLESAKTPGKFLNVDPTTNAITCETKNGSDNQKFRFVSKPANGSYTALNEIICKSVPTGSIRCENNNWDVVYNTGLAFSAGATAISLGYWPWNLTLAFGANGAQTMLQSLDGDGVGSADGSSVINSIESYDGASAWKIVVAEGADAVNTPNSADVKITIKNRTIVLTGSDAPVKAFTVSGIAVNATKALHPGVYLVKVNNVVKKVVVE